MKKDFALISVLIDISGSMGKIASDTVGGFNTFLKEQQGLPSEAQMNLVLFDDKYEKKAWMKPIKLMPSLSLKEEGGTILFKPRGSTALLDAIAKLIDETGEHLSSMEESLRPDKVIFVIITDGDENSSVKFNWFDVQTRIETQTKDFNWTFLFLGANQDAIATASKLAIPATHAIKYVANSAGTSAVYASTSNVVYATRGGGGSKTFTTRDINAQKDAGL